MITLLHSFTLYLPNFIPKKSNNIQKFHISSTSLLHSFTLFENSITSSIAFLSNFWLTHIKHNVGITGSQDTFTNTSQWQYICSTLNQQDLNIIHTKLPDSLNQMIVEEPCHSLRHVVQDCHQGEDWQTWNFGEQWVADRSHANTYTTKERKINF